MSAQSEVGICNLALGKLSADPIQSIAAPVKPNEKLLALFYTHYRDVELRKHRWRFALETRRLTPTGVPTTAGSDAPLYRYQIPNDALRAVRHEGDTWKVVGRELLDSSTTYIDVEFVLQKSPAMMDPLFVEVLACRLAVAMTEKITQSGSKKESLKDDYKDALNEAKRMNAYETGPEAWVSPVSQAYSWELARLI